MPKKVIQTDKAPKAVGAYSQAVRHGGLVFTAGQLGLDPATGKLVGADVESQARQALDNLEAVLRAAGLSLAHVLKSTVFLVDMGDFQKVNAIYAERVGVTNAPARSAVQVAGLPLGGLVEIEMIAGGDEE
ncbi:MAG: RidA family protein [Nitrospinota bacterium]|nr:RidA family protein [Nitrospinota bacterium]